MQTIKKERHKFVVAIHVFFIKDVYDCIKFANENELKSISIFRNGCLSERFFLY